MAEAAPDALRVLILEARFYDQIADMLAAGAMRALDDAGVDHERVSVPGAFELPAALAMAVGTGRYDGYVALGCVIRGETSHYDYVCGECARGLSSLAGAHRLALGFGVLTTESREQAVARADPAQQDKGGGAAKACLAMMALAERFRGEGP